MALRSLDRSSLKGLHFYPNGVLLLEMDGDQIPTAQALLDAHNFRDVRTWKDLAGTMRVLGARRG